MWTLAKIEAAAGLQISQPSPRPCAATSASKVRMPLVRRDHAEVLALGLGALADAAAHRALDLVRRADAAVALLELDRHPDRVLDAVAAPGAADAALDRAQGFAVGVPALEARVDQLLPDVRQLPEPGAEHIDPLAAGDLGVEAVLLRDLAQPDQPVGRDLAARDARHHRVGALALDVGEEAIVGVLQRVGRLQDHLVVDAGEDRGRRRLADLAALAAAVRGDQRLEGADALHPHQIEELLARVVEVLAQAGLGGLAEGRQLRREQVGHHRHAAATAGAGRGAALEGGQAAAVAGAYGLADVTLGDVVAGTDLGLVRQVRHAAAHALAAVAEDQGLGLLRQRGGGLGQVQQLPVFAGIAHQDATRERAAVLAQDELLVHALDEVLVDDLARRIATHRVAEAGDVDAEQLELGREVGARELGRAAQQVLARHVRHLVAGSHQPVDEAAVQGGLADGVDRGVAGAQGVVADDAAALADRQAAVAGQLIARADACRDHDHVDLE